MDNDSLNQLLEAVRRFVNAVQAAVRTSFYQIDRDGGPKATIAIKYGSRLLEEMPLPRPLSGCP